MVKNKYNKGAHAERELFQMLTAQNFSVVRVAGSGTIGTGPDLIALGKEKTLIFECKAWNANYLSISHEQIDDLINWAGKTNAEMYVAWKIPHKGWLFLKTENFKKTDKNYAINREKAEKLNLPFDILVGKQQQLVSGNF
ncbi:MAG: Holliday junction resolvase Hjc [Candidatus Diapherotrites archaeon]|nr:Holliday junction resolvase Hjc [Candidatus Diapherotrites archaeon]